MGKSAQWLTMIYPESEKKGWRNVFAKIGGRAIISPLHDRDVWEADEIGDREREKGIKAGDIKKPHHHVMLLWQGNTTQKNAQMYVDIIGGVGCFRPMSVTGSVRYFTHVEYPKKAQYDYKDIEIIGITADDLKKLYETESDYYLNLDGLLDFITSHRITSLHKLTNWCRKYNRDWYKIINEKNRQNILAYCRSLENDIRNGCNHELNEDGWLGVGPDGVQFGFERYVPQKIESNVSRSEVELYSGLSSEENKDFNRLLDKKNNEGLTEEEYKQLEGYCKKRIDFRNKEVEKNLGIVKENDDDDIPEWIIENRKKYGMSQDALAKIMNVSVRTIQRWEKYGSAVSNENYLKLMELFQSQQK